MNYAIFFNPLKLIERAALQISRKRRLNKLKHTVASKLKLGHIDSLEILELMHSDLKSNPVIFDIGSNIGTWTLLAKSIFPEAIVHAFEPLKQHIAVFNTNCSDLKNVYQHEFCAGNENATATINVSSYSDASSLLAATPLEYEHFSIKKIAEEKVTIKRLEDLIKDNTLPIPDIIKLDIQGFELEALKGMGQSLALVKYILCEVSFKEYYQKQPHFLDIANYLAQFNLHVFAFGNNTPIGTELNQIDVLFKAKPPVI